MSRVQLAINVSDIDSAIEFYSKLFGTAPAKVREGYANFAIAEPPLKLVLIQGEGVPGSLNHLGVEVESPELVSAATSRLQSEGLLTDVQENTTCCYAVQDKVWVHGPDSEPWEVYTVLDDASVMHVVDDACCAPQVDAVADAACCGTSTAVANSRLIPLTDNTSSCC